MLVMAVVAVMGVMAVMAVVAVMGVMVVMVYPSKKFLLRSYVRSYVRQNLVKIRPDQFNFLLLGSLQLKNGASNRKKKMIIIIPGQIKYENNTRQNSQPQKTCTPARTTYKSIILAMHSCMNDLQIHNIIQKQHKSRTWKKTLHRVPQGPKLHFHTAVSRLIRNDNFHCSPMRWSCDTRRKRSPKIISSGVKKKIW